MNLEKIFRSKKIKLTNSRKEIAKVLIEFDQPVSLEEVHQKCESADFSSVFRNMKLFTSLGLVDEINFGDKKPRYEFLVNKKHHHHIRCESCGRIDRIDDICIVDQIKEVTEYKITNHIIEFTGVCPECRNL